jgi:hypothetical protein
VETNRAKIVAKLEREGWNSRGGKAHEVFTHPERPGSRVAVPRHRALSPGVARAIAKVAGWTDKPWARALEALCADAEVRAELEAGGALVIVPLILDAARPAKANLSLDAGLLEAIDDAAEARGLTRSSFLASAAREKIVANGWSRPDSPVRLRPPIHAAATAKQQPGPDGSVPRIAVAAEQPDRTEQAYHRRHPPRLG